MARRNASRAAWGLLVLLSAACASIPLPEREGVELYRRKCAGCHRAYAPSERTPAHWRARLPEMGKRAKLSPEEYRQIATYLEIDSEPLPAR